MFNNLRGVFKNKKGFTIIEVVVVLAIMAIVSTIVAPNFKQFGNKADTEKIQSELSTVHSVALNLAEEKETELYEYFEGSKTFELKKEIQSITNYDMKKIDGYKYGVSENKFIVYIDSDEPYYWDGVTLTQTKPVGLHEINNETYAKQVAAFIKTGGYIPDVTSKYFTFTNSKTVAPDDLEYGDTITGLTNLGRKYFGERVIIPAKDNNGEKIVKIKENAFFGEGIKEVYIPKDVDVGNQAFAKNGDSKNSNSIDDTEVNKWYNGYEGEWKVIGDKWVKTVGIINIEPAGTDPFVTFTQNYQNLGLLKLHNATVITRTPNSNDPFTITSPAARPGRVVPSTFLENEGNVTVKINEDKISSWSENTLYRGTRYDTRYVVGHLSPNYSGYIDGFKFTGTLPQDNVINGGTPAGSKHVSGQTSSYYNEGGLNGYSGELSQEYVISGTPAGSKHVSSQTSSQYNDGEYSGSLSRYLYSGSPADTKYVSGQSSSQYNSEGYSGSLSPYVHSGSYTPEDTKYVSGQTSSQYNSEGYSGSLSPYVHSGSYTPEQSMYVTGQTSSYYDSGGYSGTLSSYVYSGSYTPPDSKQVNGLAISYYQDSEGYSGTLSSYLYSGSYSPAESKTATDYRTGYYQYYWAWVSSTQWGPKTLYRQGGVPFPNAISYYSGGFSGTLYKSGGEQYLRQETANWDRSSPGSSAYVTEYYMQNYSGTVTKPASDTRVYRYQGTVTRPASDTRVYRYQGTVTKPAVDTRVWRYEGNVTKPASDTRVWKYEGTVYRPDTAIYRYQGTVSKGDTRVWAYHGTVYKEDTRVWDYTGTVTGDTREYKPYYFYQLILE